MGEKTAKNPHKFFNQKQIIVRLNFSETITKSTHVINYITLQTKQRPSDKSHQTESKRRK